MPRRGPRAPSLAARKAVGGEWRGELVELAADTWALQVVCWRNGRPARATSRVVPLGVRSWQAAVEAGNEILRLLAHVPQRDGDGR